MVDWMRQPGPKAGVRTPPALPHLPDELWQQIASQLSAKEWVGASGTCKRLRQMQLEHLNIKASSADASISALLWLAKQLPGARSIVLDCWPVKSAVQQDAADKIRSTMKPALKLPLALSNLTVLKVRLGPSDHERARRSTGDYPHMGICLAPFLVQAAKLSKLELACISAAGLPPLGNLRHLALRLFRHPMSACISSLLEELPCLETLQLSHPSAIDGCTELEMEAMLVVPASVQRVKLINVFPESLVLGSDSTIVRLIGALCCLQGALEDWADVRSQIKGLRLFQRPDDDPAILDPMHVSELWDYVEVLQFMCGSVSSVNVNLHDLPRASLGNLTSLHVKMTDICITIPALPGLKDLRLDCSKTLCMSFENARVSAENLQGFELVFASMCVDNTFGIFLATLRAAGKGFALQQYSKMRKHLKRSDGTVCDEYRKQKYFCMQYGSCRFMPSDPWDDLFTACGCEGCLAGQGFDLKWTFRGSMVYSRVGFSEETVVLRPGEPLGCFIGTRCPCDRHSTYVDIEDTEGGVNQ